MTDKQLDPLQGTARIVKSRWSSGIYPCTQCDFIGSLDAFTWGQCYDPCPRCGGERKRGRHGRFVYRVEPRFWWFPWIKKRVFLFVDWAE